jgi:hypothetical protein
MNERIELNYSNKLFNINRLAGNPRIKDANRLSMKIQQSVDYRDCCGTDNISYFEFQDVKLSIIVLIHLPLVLPPVTEFYWYPGMRT